MYLVKSESGRLSLAPFSRSRHVTKIPSPQPLQNQQLQTVTLATPLESAFTKTAGRHLLFLPSFRPLCKERLTTSLQLKGYALFLKTAGRTPRLPFLERGRSERSRASTPSPSSPLTYPRQPPPLP